MPAGIDISREVRAEAAAVYRAWTTPEGLCGWLAEDATGTAAPGSTLELSWPSLGQSLELEVASARPGRSLTLRALIGGDVQVQSVELRPTASGTEVRVQHAAPADMARGIGNGWRLRLWILEHYLQVGGKRRQLTLSGTAPGAEAQVFQRVEDACDGLPRDLTLAPDALCGVMESGLIYAVRRFPLAVAPGNAAGHGTHLIAGRLMTWDRAADLEHDRPTLASVIERASTPRDAMH